jgi:hypothetical protein
MRAALVPIWTGLQAIRRAHWPSAAEVSTWYQALSEGARTGLQELEEAGLVTEVTGRTTWRIYAAATH